MKTRIVDRKDIDEVVKVLNHGGVVAFPTDTVYGIGVVYDNLDALNRLKLSKGRPDNKPIPMMIGSVEQVKDVAITNEKIQRLTNTFMPGGFTIVLNKMDCVCDEITNGFKTIALRMPDDEFICEVIKRLNKPMLVTSANLSGMPTGVYFDDVYRDFNNRIDMIVKGECKGSVSSTIVDASGEHLKVLREGALSVDEIMKVWG